MGREMGVHDLDIGPHKGSQARNLGILDAPSDPKQTKLRCFRCLNYLTSKTTPQVLSKFPLVLKPGIASPPTSATPLTLVPTVLYAQGMITTHSSEFIYALKWSTHVSRHRCCFQSALCSTTPSVNPDALFVVSFSIILFANARKFKFL